MSAADAQIERAIGYRFRRPELLAQALTHRSAGVENNERLEFLGDSILNAVVSIALYHRFPALREGELSRLRASLVREASLHQIAQSLSLGEALRLGEGERRSGGHRRPSILADAFEALLAAVHLDGGLEVAAALIDRLYASRIDAINPEASHKDAKTALQEWLQARQLPLPNYVTRSVQGAAHAQAFEVECHVASLSSGTIGTGSSRRRAEQDAARLALERLLRECHE